MLETTYQFGRDGKGTTFLKPKVGDKSPHTALILSLPIFFYISFVYFFFISFTLQFDQIASAIKKAKVVVACISEQYAISDNCKMEFQFAATSLKKPIIAFIVGKLEKGLLLLESWA